MIKKPTQKSLHSHGLGSKFNIHIKTNAKSKQTCYHLENISIGGLMSQQDSSMLIYFVG